VSKRRLFRKGKDRRKSSYNPVGKIAEKKQSEKECVFVNSALKMQCHIRTGYWIFSLF